MTNKIAAVRAVCVSLASKPANKDEQRSSAQCQDRDLCLLIVLHARTKIKPSPSMRPIDIQNSGPQSLHAPPHTCRHPTDESESQARHPSVVESGTLVTWCFWPEPITLPPVAPMHDAANAACRRMRIVHHRIAATACCLLLCPSAHIGRLHARTWHCSGRALQRGRICCRALLLSLHCGLDHLPQIAHRPQWVLSGWGCQ